MVGSPVGGTDGAAVRKGGVDRRDRALFTVYEPRGASVAAKETRLTCRGGFELLRPIAGPRPRRSSAGPAA